MLQQKTTSRAAPVHEEQETEGTVHLLTKIRQLNTGTNLPGLISKNYCNAIWMVGLEFGVEKQKRMDPTCLKLWFRLGVVV